jgi:hypothetical protein
MTPKKLETQTLHVEEVPITVMRKLRIWAVQHGLTIKLAVPVLLRMGMSQGGKRQDEGASSGGPGT